MSKVRRTFWIEKELSKQLSEATTPPYTYTWHIEQALKAYLEKLKKDAS